MKRILTIFFLLLAAMLVTGYISDHYYKKFWWPFFNKLDVVFTDSAYYDGIYLGDSRTHFGINPSYIDAALHTKTYNIGMGGASISEINFLATAYLQKHIPPKFAVISIGYSNIFEPEKFFENPCYYFFYSNDSFVNRILQDQGYHTSLYRLLPVTKYTAFDDFNKFSIAESLKGRTFLKAGGVAYNGFISNSTSSFNIQDAEKAAAADTGFYKGMLLLENLIQNFITHHTLPVLVYPPANHTHAPAAVELKIDSAATALSDRFNIPLIRFDKDPSFTPALFTDQWHLNIEGTTQYSRKLAAALHTVLSK